MRKAAMACALKLHYWRSFSIIQAESVAIVALTS